MSFILNRAALCVIGMSLITACASSPSHFYKLTSIQCVPDASPSSIGVVVGPVSVPESLDRPQMVLNVAPNQVAIDDFNRWAGPLQSEIQRVIAENLIKLLGTPRVFQAPQSTLASPDFRVGIQVLSFESELGGAATLAVLWTVRGKETDEVETRYTTLRESISGKGFDALAAAHSRALGKLSRDIAEAILGMEHQAK